MTITIVILIAFIGEALMMYNAGYRTGYQARKRHAERSYYDTERETL